MTASEKLNRLKSSLPTEVELVAVSKTHPAEQIMEVYGAGQRIFGESRPQELRDKHEFLPKDIKWHMIGHLQSNKVKYIAPFVELIHSVDSDKLLSVIDKEAAKNNRNINILLEVHLAVEETKSGWDVPELSEYLASGEWKRYRNINIKGLMAIASLTDDTDLIKNEFILLTNLFANFKQEYFGSEFNIISAGMTSDYEIAIECGSNMVRIGSLIFGER